MNKQKPTPVSPIDTARLIALKGAVRLEGLGMKHSSGKSMRKVACRELGLTLGSSHDTVIGALNRAIDKRIAQAAMESGAGSTQQ